MELTKKIRCTGDEELNEIIMQASKAWKGEWRGLDRQGNITTNREYILKVFEDINNLLHKYYYSIII